MALPSPLPAQSPGTTAATQRPDPKAARAALDAGKSAEAQGRWEDALAAYDKAARLDPRDAAAIERGAALRSRIVHEHADNAERLALAGAVDQAAAELRAALRADPGNPTVQERLRQISTMALSPAAPENNFAGIPHLQPLPGTRSFNSRGDTQTVYLEVAQAFGLKVLFDPDLPSRSVRFRANEVDFATALSILQAETATFIRPMDAATFLVAPDSAAKRREHQLTVEQMFVLPDSTGLEEMTELLHVIRTISGSAHLNLDIRTHTITARDTPETVALVGEIIRQSEQARGELMLEIEMLEVNRSKAQQLGIAPPTGAQLLTFSPDQIKSLEQAKNLQTLIGILQPILAAQGGASAALASQLAGGTLPGVVALGGGKSTVLLAFPTAAATFSDALSLVRSGRRILLRAQDGKPATFFVGDRFPITLSLLSSSTGTGAAIPSLGANILPRNDIAVGAAPIALAANDFNEDGLPDLAVVNHNDNSVTILLNQGGGTGNLAPATGSPIALGATETGPSAIAAASLNNQTDSFTDLLITNQTSNNVTVLQGNDDGTFTPMAGSPIAVGISPSGIVTADFDGDGNTDFAVTNSGDNTISVFLGDGTGAFAPAPGSPLALSAGELGPTAIVAADLDNDGKQDLTVVNRTSNNVSILRGNGDATFTPMTLSPIIVGTTPVALAARDLNGDAHADLVIVNQVDNTLTVLLNNGDGTFIPSVVSPLPTSTTPTGVAIADFNADSISDIVVTNQGADSVGVYVGLGAGLFLPRFELPAVSGGGASAIVVADMNGDSRPDAVLAEENTNQVSIIFNPSSFLPGGGNSLQQPYPASEYVDLGVKVKATPVLHPNNEVTLQLEFEIRSLSGSALNGIPILSNRTISQTVRIKENETTLIGGLLDRQETNSLTGLPGFASVPGAGYLFSKRSPQSQDTEFLILVTPRQLRLPVHSSRTIYAGRGGGPSQRGEGGGVPPPLPPPPAPQN